MTVSSQHDDKWTASGKFGLQNDHFPQKDWGELLNREEISCLNSKSGLCVSLQMAGEKGRQLPRRNVLRSMRCAVQNKGITLIR